MHSTQVSRLLDDEHQANIVLLGQLQQTVARAQRHEAGHDVLLGQLQRLLEYEVDRHFGFEEEQLFPRMADSGDGGLASLLQEEHDSIRAVARELLPLTQEALAGGMAEGGWSRLRPLVLELAERLTAHIDKETMALLPVIDDLLDDGTDRELAFGYTAG